MINCIIIEDEPLATEKLVEFISKVPFLQLIVTFDNGLDAINYLRTNDTDLVFLDIQMKDLNGIQFLNSLTSKPKIIITSAYSEFAIDGYEHSVLDYLLKPFGFDRFLRAVNKISGKLNTLSVPENDLFFVKTEYRIEKILLKDILFVEGMKDYLAIVTNKGKVLTLLSFDKILDILPPSKFIRVHKSFIVAIERIENIERSRIKISDRLIPISETYKDAFYNTLKNNKMMI